jgi:hypothetical protein
MRQPGHRSTKSLDRCMRPRGVFLANSAAWIGLVFRPVRSFYSHGSHTRHLPAFFLPQVQDRPVRRFGYVQTHACQFQDVHGTGLLFISDQNTPDLARDHI